MGDRADVTLDRADVTLDQVEAIWDALAFRNPSFTVDDNAKFDVFRRIMAQTIDEARLTAPVKP